MALTLIKDLNDYQIKEKISIGTSGTRLKLWLEKDNNIVLLKIPKVHTSGEATFEDISEYLVYNVFKNFGFSIIPSYLGIYKGLRGSFTFKNENIYELTDYLSSEYIDYDFTKFASRDFTYNIETLSKLLNGNEFWNMMLLDFFIGNSDRHPGNIMIDEKFKEELNKLCNENLISEDRVKLIKEFILYKISLYKKV